MAATSEGAAPPSVSSAPTRPAGPVELRATERDELALLLVDDEPAILGLMQDILKSHGFSHAHEARDGAQALTMLRESPYDIVLLDIHMPRIRGEEVLQEIGRMYGEDVTVIIMTGYATVEQAVDLLHSGAFDYIVKPFRIARVVASLERAEQRCRYVRALAGAVDLVAALVRLMESKDPYLRNHSTRVRDYAIEIGRALGMDSRSLRLLEYAALLHDLGKSAIDSRILNKKGPLADEEMAEVRRHPAVSRDIILSNRYLARLVPYVYLHHERWDGTGYPEGLKGEDIPLPARIIAVADAYDAMTSDRAYRPAMSPREAVEVLRRNRETTWCPTVVDAFLSIVPEMAYMEDQAGEGAAQTEA